MLVLNHKDEAQALLASGVALTVGSFDGLHLGHQSLVARLKKEAKGAKTAVLTFDPHPDRVLSAKPLKQIFNKQDQIDVLSQMGIDYLFFIPFDKALAGVDAATFAQTYIIDLFKPSVIVVGYDFVFGKNRSGSFQLLESMAQGKFKVIQIEPVKDQGDVVSSSLIRHKIEAGEVERVGHLLGRPFYILGHVVEGRKLGRQLGFPTANLTLTGEIAPGPGVYFCALSYKSEILKAVCNVGFNPTVSTTSDRKIECHILDFNREIYGERVQVSFLRKLRDEKKFESLDALKAQIASDVAFAKTLV